MQTKPYLLVVGLDAPRRIVFVSSGEALMTYLAGTGLIATITEASLEGSTLKMIVRKKDHAVRIQTHFRDKHGYGRSFLTTVDAEETTEAVA